MQPIFGFGTITKGFEALTFKNLLLVQGTRQMQIYDECSRNSYDYEIRDYDTIQDPCMAKQQWPAPTLPGWRSVEVIQNYNVVNVT